MADQFVELIIKGVQENEERAARQLRIELHDIDHDCKEGFDHGCIYRAKLEEMSLDELLEQTEGNWDNYFPSKEAVLQNINRGSTIL
jgi:hypothetical protein